ETSTPSTSAPAGQTTVASWCSPAGEPLHAAQIRTRPSLLAPLLRPRACVGCVAASTAVTARGGPYHEGWSVDNQRAGPVLPPGLLRPLGLFGHRGERVLGVLDRAGRLAQRGHHLLRLVARVAQVNRPAHRQKVSERRFQMLARRLRTPLAHLGVD